MQNPNRANSHVYIITQVSEVKSLNGIILKKPQEPFIYSSSILSEEEKKNHFKARKKIGVTFKNIQPKHNMPRYKVYAVLPKITQICSASFNLLSHDKLSS